MQRQIEGFNQAIKHDLEPTANGKYDLIVIQIIEAMIESASTRTTVKPQPPDSRSSWFL